ncbi:MAG: BrnT family toxin [Defluviitaleaceae bacterium]|nr:BrnT family toxin [Defluviitaleaceae bacterium]
MRFDWNPDKNKSNIKKHGVDFKEAETVFQDEMALEMFDEEHSEVEDRYIIIGISSKTRELTVCHCYRNSGDIIRIISARRATKNEAALYEKRYGN